MMKTNRLYRLKSSVFLITVFIWILISALPAQAAPESEGESPIHYTGPTNAGEALVDAAFNGDAAQVKSLLADGTPVDYQLTTGITALIRACFMGYAPIVKILLDHGMDVNLRLAGGTTPLHSAASYGHIAVIELLLQRGADVNAKRSDGRTAKDSASSGGHYAARDLLAERGETARKIVP